MQIVADGDAHQRHQISRADTGGEAANE